MSHAENNEFFKGRGAQINPHSKFRKNKYVTDHIEGLDEELHENSSTQIYYENAKKIISTSNSPDLHFMHSINPYQGCEHGCLYCYARNAHEYWGFSAGLDFERKIIAKQNAAELLEAEFNKKGYTPATIMLSGNTDCYQPIERKLKITRSLLEVFLKYKHPVSIISKNNLITRDFDILQEMAKYDLVHVAVTLNSLNESLRQKLEPRTVTAKSRLVLISRLNQIDVPVRLMMAPIIPCLNSDEIPDVIKAASESGASAASFTLVRLNGAIAEIFTDWIYKAYPDRADKVLHAIASCHGGRLNDSRWGNRMVGDGNIADSIHQLFRISLNRWMSGKAMRPLNLAHFTPGGGKQLQLF